MNRIKCLPLMNTVFQQPLVININLVRLNNEHDDSTKNKTLTRLLPTQTKQTNKQTNKVKQVNNKKLP